MSLRFRKLLLGGVPLVILCITSVVLITRASSDTKLATGRKSSLPARAKDGPRNLSLQPEALRVARRLGKRFGPSARGTSVMVGTATINGNEQPLTLTRRQTEHGEDITLVLSGRPLTWSAADGIKAGPNAPGESERLLIERLIYDSPDYFVLAQLRAAQSSTVTAIHAQAFVPARA